MSLSDHIKDEVLDRFLINSVLEFHELKGGMSSNKCFYIKTELEDYTLIVFREDKRTDEEILAWHDVVNSLKDFSLEVRTPIGNQFEKFEYQGKSLKAFLYSYIQGQTIPWGSYNSNEIVQLGKVMRVFHEKLSNCTAKLPKWDQVILNEIEQFINYYNFAEPYIKEKLSIQIDTEKLISNTRSIIEFVLTNQENTVLHYDFHRANLIFLNGNLKGIIDFEKACIGPRIADIAKSCTYLILDKKKHSTKYVKHYFFEGYGEDIDLKLLEPLIIHYFLFELKGWLYNTPFEDLENNTVFNKIISFLDKHHYVKRIKQTQKQ